jgi:hypothetical protein
MPATSRVDPAGEGAAADEDAGDFCDPFGFCQGWLHQLEVAGGVAVRF